MLTLLAPARDISVARAAIQAGADAIYIGAPKFGARQSAGNTIEDICTLVKEASVYGVKVLVTVNTLLSDEERKEAARMIWQLYEAGVDAVIVQDLRLLREDMPPIRLHASTQCDNRTAEQVVRMQRLGFKRAVLARELNIDEIKAIRQATIEAAAGAEPIELEAFVHGALCVCYSGRCYMSEVMLSRSANRGECAQMCRMRYDLLDGEGNEIIADDGQPIHQRYLLSLQDMDRHLYVKQLIEAGVTTFKIEGRLKDSDYVTNIVAYYRGIIDSLKGQPRHRYTYTFTPDPQKTFHRGATDYFLAARTRPMANFLTPKSTGERIGRVVAVGRSGIDIQINKGVAVINGDGLCYADEGFAVNRVSLTDKSDIIRVVPNCDCRPAVGTDIYRSKDTRFLSSLGATRKIPVRITISETQSGFALSMYDLSDNSRLLASTEVEYVKQEAKDKARAAATINEQLQKTGNTPFVAEEVIAQTKPYFIPVSLLNLWRRTLTDKAVEQLQAAERKKDMNYTSAPRLTYDSEDLEPYKREPRELMTCRYCLLFEMGHCRKKSPLTTEPKFLRLLNGEMMQLGCDCAKCEMHIMSIR